MTFSNFFFKIYFMDFFKDLTTECSIEKKEHIRTYRATFTTSGSKFSRQHCCQLQLFLLLVYSAFRKTKIAVLSTWITV